MKKLSFVFALIAVSMNGCTHSLMRGSVAMKVSDQEGYVCLGDNDLKVGDKVAIFRQDCTTPHTGRPVSVYTPYCKKIKLGSGEVTSLINEHYSVVRAPTNIVLQEGMIIEKL